MKVAFVTGSNKGIGKAIVSKLAGTLQTTGRWDIYLTARNVERGRQACADLAKQGLDVKFHQLDITDKNSRQRFLEFINSHYPNGINVAVNNAGIAYIIRVVHLSSLLGHNALRKLSPLLYDKFTSPLTMVELQSLAIDFVR
ncbi:Carbonyl reductase 1 [Fasciola hepatica]|uniref:Carbonyl reductase 1 n=1 Tax=Fasciola hepatica TaxID=6192 RepID=A0A4E0QXY6_FASHE|nr:Carbonyl reductase 1 [Fasciola hepatica]